MSIGFCELRVVTASGRGKNRGSSGFARVRLITAYLPTAMRMIGTPTRPSYRVFLLPESFEQIASRRLSALSAEIKRNDGTVEKGGGVSISVMNESISM